MVSAATLGHLETGHVEAVASVLVDETQQSLLLLHRMRRLELVESAQVEEDALLKKRHRLLHHPRLQGLQGVCEAPHVEGTHSHVVDGLERSKS